ncbi:5-methyltetrahydropteroyltriglutamate--homocysteine S-methyltransferase [Neisseria perflava]|uniref:5-methyltetrahydropteroyltriglutamate-- homocysteine S-methyltransferase n=1 Tax=Neisseria perflava TaxID=33053 RepID=UPI0020A04B4B|nr:5-methyltetrahydropteroyltriglutamate--homocysteine S-methyltransferase [Neisseria perflava]MCP1659091.1 5-methyltetrahydropteroyltriglutamate--homocysteine methyltransferase [Neisseria perflava]MCP1771414.1 5-methyltetrahydropteroyltriglutamate--homocysteine methyltransferase [Neisseria perflava]
MSTLFPNATLRERAPFRYDIVGSFLRPERLKKARQQCACGELPVEELHKVEDEEVLALIAKEKAVGLPNVTDGEFRRTWWHLDFLFELSGVELVEAQSYSTQFQTHMSPVTLKIIDKIEFPQNHPFVAHFKALQTEADGYPTKFTIPSPSMIHLITCVRTENPQLPERYAGNEAQLLADVTQAYIDAANALYAAGCRILQLDDTSWGEFCSQDKRAGYAARGLDLDAIAKSYVKVLNDIRAAIPADMALTMHICRGNFRSTWSSSGGYEPVAEILFGGCHVDGFFLEYDSERAGDFKPLRFIKDQQVVLGLVTSKFGELEDRNVLIERIKEAAQYVDINQLCLSPQCGFASTEHGNELTEEDQWKKLALIRSVVEEVWGSK